MCLSMSSCPFEVYFKLRTRIMMAVTDRVRLSSLLKRETLSTGIKVPKLITRKAINLPGFQPKTLQPKLVAS